MSNQNQSQQPQPQRSERLPKPDDMLTVRVRLGCKLLKQHVTDGEDVFYQPGEVLSVTRAYFDQHTKSRSFDSYHRADGAILDRPVTMNDPTIELVEDPVVEHNKIINRAA
jgi:hypothetical protein